MVLGETEPGRRIAEETSVILKLTCGSCKTQGIWEGEHFEEAAAKAHEEGWFYLTFSPIGKLTRTKLADLCPKCFGAMQYRLAPPTLTMSQS